MGPLSPLACPDRLAVLHTYLAFDPERDSRFDRLARLAAAHCRTPFAAITLLESGRAFNKGYHGDDLRELDLSSFPGGSVFSQVVVERDELVVISDTRATEQFSANPLVMREPGLRFYAGVPLRSPEGAVLGALCVMDTAPRDLSDGEAAFLDDLAALTMSEMELSRQFVETAKAQEQARQAQVRHRTAIARLDGLLEQAPFGIALFDDALRYTHVNHWLAHWNDLPAADHLGHTPAEVISGTMDPATMDLIARARAGEYLNGVQLTPQSTRPYKNQVDFRATCFPVSLGGDEAGVGVIVQDVTEWKEAKRGLDRFFALAPDMLCLADGENRLVRVSASWTEQLGWAEEELVGREFLDLVHPEDREATLQITRDLASGKAQVGFRNRYRTHDGRYRLLEWTASVDGPYCYAIARDITEEQRQAERLHASETAFRTLAENLPDFVGRWTPDLRMVYVAPSTAAALGLDLDATPRPTIEDLPFSPTVQRQAEAHLRRVFETGTPARFAFSMLSDDGEQHFESFSVPELDANGRVVSVLSTSRDVTERKLHEEALIQAKEEAVEMARLKDALLSNMSHEVRTPLTSILGYIELLREEAPGALSEYVDEIMRNGNRLRDTLTSVLDLAQLRTGTVQPTVKRVDLGLLIRDTLLLFEREAQRRGLRLDATRVPEQLPIDSDPAAVSRILHNLIGNAIKFTPEGRVSVWAESTDRELTLVVEDTGIGIAEDFLPRLFDDFQQESTGMTRTHEGVGLGLPITDALVRMLGGRISVESRKQVGTTFRVTLPRSTSAPEPLGISATHRPRILVVEDNASTRHLVELVLRNLADTVIRASGEEGLAAVSLGPFDVVLLDLHLGRGLSGSDVLAALRATDACRHAQFIAMTAYAMPGDSDRLLEDGFDTFLRKPFTRAELVDAVRDALTAEAPPTRPHRTA